MRPVMVLLLLSGCLFNQLLHPLHACQGRRSLQVHCICRTAAARDTTCTRPWQAAQTPASDVSQALPPSLSPHNKHEFDMAL